MNWDGFPLWEFCQIGNLYAVKVTPTAVHTSVRETHKDECVRIEVHATDNDRLIGYTIRGRKRGKKPLRLIQPSCLSLFYSNTRAIKPGVRQPMDILYHDSNVRFLAFGTGGIRDYMMVLRTRM